MVVTMREQIVINLRSISVDSVPFGFRTGCCRPEGEGARLLNRYNRAAMTPPGGTQIGTT